MKTSTPLKPLHPESLSPGLYKLEEATIVEILQSFPSWKYTNTPNGFSLYYVHLENSVSDEQPPVAISHVIAISDGSWQLWIWGQLVVRDTVPALQQLPDALDVSSLKCLVSTLQTTPTCRGIQRNLIMQLSKSEVDLDSLPQLAVVGSQYRSRRCCTLLDGGDIDLCRGCKTLKHHLQVNFARQQKKENAADTPPKNTPNVALSTPQKLAKLATLAREKHAALRKVSQLQDRIAALTAESGIVVNKEMDADLKAIMNLETEKVYSTFPEDSFQHLFWKQQVMAHSATGPQQRRWHPLLIKWCLNLRMMSSAAYHNLRTSGMLQLPSERTLRDYSNVIKSGDGFHMDVLKQLYDEARMGSDEIPAHKQFIGIAFDEIYIKSDLVYDRHSGKVIGFVNLGAVDQQLAALEQESKPIVATRVLTLMARGLFFRLNFPVASFPTAGITCVNLFNILWTAVEHLERCDFRVVFQTADGSSPNRRYFRMHRDPACSNGAMKKVVHQAVNPYSMNGSNIVYFFSDPPHLMKTVRNSLANSRPGRSRLMWNGMDITWRHLLQLEEELRHCSVTSGGLSVAPKLKREHFHLTSYSKMRVDLAVQILSRTTSEALKFYSIRDSAATQTLLLFMDRFFDMLNVRSPEEAVKKRKDDLRPYSSAEDSRLTWLEEGFLAYLDDWEDAVRKRDGFRRGEQELMLLSSETRVGLRITVNSFVGMLRELLKYPELKGKYLLSERISQDPLENFFGKVRQAGGRNANPSVKTMQEATDVLRLQASSALDVVRSSSRLKTRLFGNSEGYRKVTEHDIVPLPKRKPICIHDSFMNCLEQTQAYYYYANLHDYTF